MFVLLGGNLTLRCIRVLLLIFLLLEYGGIQAGATPDIRVPDVIPTGRILSIDDCINLALKNQPTVHQAQAQIKISTGAVSVARSSLYPSIGVNGSTSLGGSRGNSGTTISGSASELLYDFGLTQAQLTQAKQNKTASVFGLSAAKADVVFNVKQAYYTLLRSNRLVEVFQENLKAQKEHVAQAQARLDVGVAPKADLLTAQAAEASATVDLITAQSTAAQALINLNIAMGLDVRSPTQIKEFAEPESAVAAIDDLVVQAIKNRPEIAQAVWQLDAAVAALKASKKGNLPSISVSAGDEATIGVPSGSGSWALALNLQWRPVDFGLTKGQITESQGQLMLTEEALYVARQTVSQETATARLDITTALSSLTAANAEVASAQENLNAAAGRYEAGIGIFIQVTDAQAALLKAEVDEAAARYGLSIARSELEHAIGATTPKGTYK